MTEPDDGALDVEARFATVPEWLLRAPISDRAKTLYAVIQRFGNSSGARMPGRAELAAWLNNCSKSSISRAIAELEDVGALRVSRSFAPGAPSVNRYFLRTSDVMTPRPVAQPAVDTDRIPDVIPDTPASSAQVDYLPDMTETGSAPVAYPAGGEPAESATSALRRPPVRHNRENNKKPPPPTPSPELPPITQPEVEGDSPADELDELLGEPLVQLVTDCRRIRADLGLPVGAWTLPNVLKTISGVRLDYEPAAIPAALRAVAADPATQVPGRLKGAGPWWDTRSPAAAAAPCPAGCDNGWMPQDPTDLDDDPRPQRCTTCRGQQRASA
jgi:hypothetical protein